jgi:hypothetical protein
MAPKVLIREDVRFRRLVSLTNNKSTSAHACLESIIFSEYRW